MKRMEGYSRKGDGCPQLLDLLQKQNKEWGVKREEDETNCRVSDEKKLELSLGPPGGDGWTIKDGSSHIKRDENKSLFTFNGYFSNTNTNTDHKFSSPWSSQTYQAMGQTQRQPKASSPFLQLQSSPRPKESSQACCSKVVDLQQTAAEQKGLTPAVAAANTAVTNTAQKRTAPTPVVGWPPVRSFRKNLASSSSLKSAPESPNVVPNKVDGKKPIENSPQGKFVKINMDGIPIGRKVDLAAYDNYEKLSSAVDDLFRGLLAVQSDSSAGGIENRDQKERKITGLLDGSGEYTLVYEDNEGDRMLVGDVPWHMFVSTVKRLRVLKSSELNNVKPWGKAGKALA